ncbi:hypothetical protein [Rhodanobacter sp. A1T4]|uniref:hypothetical protein n=1 Tax=Rhodanobacter sp. A1T4 TaxID=2723087 RepID=UPI001618E8CF|nr:hypothetical protein [Rhodanobacter sp. A1T4]MBB6247671.1 hypothetical protein [Rhodanobacter sp. A1T4]
MIPASRKNTRKVQTRLGIVQSPIMSSQSLTIVPQRQPAMALQKKATGDGCLGRKTSAVSGDALATSKLELGVYWGTATPCVTGTVTLPSLAWL